MIAAYAYRAAFYCPEHGEGIIRNLTAHSVADNGDTEAFPQAVPGWEIQADDCCDACLAECIEAGSNPMWARL